MLPVVAGLCRSTDQYSAMMQGACTMMSDPVNDCVTWQRQVLAWQRVGIDACADWYAAGGGA